MKQLLMLMLSTVILTGCNFSLGPVAERETIWARMGSSGRVVGKCETEILVTTKSGDVRTKANLQGMMVVDQPTYDALLRCWKDSKPPMEESPEATEKTKL